MLFGRDNNLYGVIFIVFATQCCYISTSSVSHVFPVDVQNEIRQLKEQIYPWLLRHLANNDSHNQTECNKHIVNYIWQAAHGKQWAIEMADAAGKIEPGLLWGNVFSLGSYSECRNITIPSNQTNDRSNAPDIPFTGASYFLSSIFLNATLQGHYMGALAFLWGLCLPEVCTTSSVQSTVVSIFEMLPVKLQDMVINITVTRIEREQDIWRNPSSVIALVILVVIILVVLMATIYDVAIQPSTALSNSLSVSYSQLTPAVHDEFNSENVSSNGINRSTSHDEIEPASVNNSVEVKLTRSSQQNISLLKQTVLSFSLRTNMKLILDTGDLVPNEIYVLHGLRVVSMLWIILGNTLFLPLHLINNALSLLDLVKTVLLQVLLTASLAVDTFYFLSGFLLVYVFHWKYNSFQFRNRFLCCIWFIVHRYWRLTVLNASVMFLFYMTLSVYIGEGPLWPIDGFSPQCNTYWWRNLLYIQSFYPFEEMCLPWSWFLSNEFWYFVIGTFILLCGISSPVIGISLCLVVLIGSWIATMMSVINNHYVINTIDPFSVIANFLPLLQNLYTKPWSRFGAYVIGMAVAQGLLTIGGMPRIPKWFIYVGWCIFSALALMIAFGTYHVDLKAHTTAAYITFAPTCWGVFIGWIVFASASSRGKGAVSNFLSWKFFVPLSRLTYSAYLMHPLLILMNSYGQEVPIHFSIGTILFSFLGYVLGSYILALVVSLFLEMPSLSFINILRNRYILK